MNTRVFPYRQKVLSTHSDAISLLCPTLSGMQCMLRICENDGFNLKILEILLERCLIKVICGIMNSEHSLHSRIALYS